MEVPSRQKRKKKRKLQPEAVAAATPSSAPMDDVAPPICVGDDAGHPESRTEEGLSPERPAAARADTAPGSHHRGAKEGAAAEEPDDDERGRQAGQADDVKAKPAKAAPVLPWMRLPISIEAGQGTPMEDVRGLDPRLRACLRAGPSGMLPWLCGASQHGLPASKERAR